MNKIWICCVEQITLLLFCLFFIQLQQCNGESDDYWSDDFENYLDCESKDEMKILSNKKPSQCEDVPIRNGEKNAFLLCITQLTIRLQKLCDFSHVEKPGDLMYCKMRGFITCCFINHKCFLWNDDDDLQFSNIFWHVQEYLKDKHAYLNNFITPRGYKTCHPLDSLDASKCAKDCDGIAKEAFAQTCTYHGGLFKCCVRRQRGWVRECNICCTLPMCTYPPGGISNTVFEYSELKLKDQPNLQRAKDLFNSKETLWMEDYRCLKPNSHKDPTKWHTYELEAYRTAYSHETLASVQSFPYNKYAYNFADPEVVKAVTKNDENARKFWRKGHGFYFAATIPGIERRTNGQDFSMNVSTCTTKCIDMENSKFTKYCHKKGGYFKCCVSEKSLYLFPKMRYKLIKEGLIKGNPKYPCKPSSTNDPCRWCTLDGICTLHNPLTGELSQMFYPDKKRRTLSDKQKNKWDGPGFGDRFNWCTVLDICKYGTSKANTLFYDKDGFQEAASKEEVCTLKKNSLVPGLSLETEGEKEKDDYLCSKLKTENIFLCSDEDKKNVTDPNIVLFNDLFEKKINYMKSLRKQNMKVSEINKNKKTNKRRNQRKGRTTRKGKKKNKKNKRRKKRNQRKGRTTGKNKRRNRSRPYKKRKKNKKIKKNDD